MEENITITKKEYRELLEAAIKLDVVASFLHCTTYPSTDDIKVIIGIKEEAQEDGV